MADFEMYFSDEEREQAQPPRKTIICGDVTPEEYEQAMEELYQEELL